MTEQRLRTEIDGRVLSLTNLDKVLYPATGTTKSEIIGYFAEVAHVMIPHLAGRPVTRKRWPDGVSTTPFFHKNLDRGTPSWVSRWVIEHSDGPKAYPVVDSPATLAWLEELSREIAALLGGIAAIYQRNVKRLLSGGVTIVAGSSAGST